MNKTKTAVKTKTQKLTKAATLNELFNINTDVVHKNVFKVEFKSKHITKSEAKMLDTMLTSLNFDRFLNNDFGITFDKACNMTFDLKVVNGKIQPLTIIEKLKQGKPNFTKPTSEHKTFQMDIITYDNARKIELCRTVFTECNVHNYQALSDLSVSSVKPATMDVTILYKTNKMILPK